jgi:hypothetical protein
MFMATKIRALAVSAICLAVCSWLTSTLAAQQTTPYAPGIQQPRSRAVSSRYQPRMMRPASQGQVIHPVAKASFGTPYTQQMVIEGSDDGYIVDEGFSDYPDDCGGCGHCAACTSCFGGTEADCYNCGPAIDPRDCDVAEDCWLRGLGGLLCNTEFSFGAQGFKNQVFATPGANRAPENCSFGLYTGFNTGLPLYKVTCGVVSGQVGLNYVQSNFEDGFFSTSDRQQTFITAGLFRRVDYGLQFGTVADILNESWIGDLEVVQIRGELSWVWTSGQTFGFRLTRNVQDDTQTIGDTMVPATNAQAMDQYRLFYRYACCNGGYAEATYGRSDDSHSIFAVDFDLPLSHRCALQTGCTYLSPDNSLALTDNEAWNISLGLSFRPRGNDWYKFYHRPLFDVADNGSMIISRK